jgi:hypothetical protein
MQVQRNKDKMAAATLASVYPYYDWGNIMKVDFDVR